MRFALGGRTPAAVWRRDGSIVFAPSASGTGLLMVSEQGGEWRSLLDPDPASESDFHRPSLLPDGAGLLFVVDRPEAGTADTIGVLAGGVRRDVLQLDGETLDAPVYSTTGHIVYHRETTAPGIWAVPFSLERLETTGDPFLVAAGGSWPLIGPGGTLIHADAQLSGLMQLAWVDTQGEITPAFSETFRGISSPRLSPDGHRVAAVIRSERHEGAVTIFDLRRGTRSVIERLPTAESEVTWLGHETVVISTAGVAGAGLLVRKVDGTGGETIPATGAGMPDGSRDGRMLLFARGGDIWHRTGAAPELLLGTPSGERYPAISPDGTLLAYASSEAGPPEVFLRPYPGDGPKVQVSSHGGQAPRWSPAGDRIYYRGPVGDESIAEVMEVTVDRRDGLTLGRPRAVPIPGGVETFPGGFDPASDGRLLIVRGVGGRAAPALVVMQNWVAAISTR
jgi:eukaryotic-like serine/threonine-protein kinase